jgi:hypothetical protein
MQRLLYNAATRDLVPAERREVTAKFLQQIEGAVRNGLSVAQIERKFGVNNRAIRRAKAELYNTGKLFQPVGYESKDKHASNTR